MKLATVLTVLALAPAALSGSLPAVPSGARPGPDVLYAPPPAAPQLENRNPRFRAAPLLVSGAEAYVDGEYLYQDHLFDDYGSDTDGIGAVPLSARVGDITYPTDRARYGDNAADLVELRIAVDPDAVAYRVTLNTLLATDSTIVAIAFDTDRNMLTGSAVLPRDPGAPFPGTDEVITIWGSGAEHTRLSPLPVTTPLPVTADLEANQLTVVVPRTVSNPSGTWRTTVVTGLYDPATGGWLRPQSSATATTPGGAGPLDPLPSGIFNVAFRFDEPYLGSDTPPDTNQAVAIRNKTPTAYARDIVFANLDAGVSRSTVPASGIQIRIFPSRLALGEGRQLGLGGPDYGTFPEYLGQLQPYSLYVPTTYSPGTPADLTLNLHSLGEHHWQYNGATMNLQMGEQRGNLVATALSRGQDGWYQREAEYDVFEMWNDVAARFTLDPDRTAISGYSMGGYATYRLGGLYPDLFGKAFTQVGPPADGIWVPPSPPTGGAETLSNVWLENTRNLPYLNLAASNDELVPLVGPRAQNLGAPELGIRGFDQLGYRFRFLVFAPAEHFTLAALGYDFPMAPAFLGDAFVDRNPPRVTFAYVPASDDAALGLVHDHAYWVSALILRDANAGDPAKGVIDALSHGFGVGDPPSTAGTATGTLGPLTYEEFNRSWGPPPAIPAANRLDVTVRNLDSVHADLSRAALDPGSPLVVHADAGAAATLHLDGAFPACSRASRDGTPLPAPSPSGGSFALPLDPGVHDYTIACPATPALHLRRVKITPGAAGTGRLVLTGSLDPLLAALGLPGQDVAFTIEGSGFSFTGTVPASRLAPNASGTRVRFRDPGGTVAGGITRLRLGGTTRTDVRLVARSAALGAAAAGGFTATIEIGDDGFVGAGTLRAKGTGVAYP